MTFLATLEEVPAPVPPPRLVGIYFLFDEDEVVYVGQSINVPQRIIAHQARREHPHERHRTKWDRALWMPLPECDLDAYEGAAIRRLTPRYNIGAPVDVGRDDEICAALNLPPRDLARLAIFLDRRRVSYGDPQRDRADRKRRQEKSGARGRAAALRKRLGVAHIKSPRVRARKARSRLLWNAVVHRLEAA